MKGLSTRLRLTIFYGAVLIGALCCFAVAVWWVEGRLGLRRVDHELDGVAATVRALFVEELREGDDVAAAARSAQETIRTADRSVAVVSADRAPADSNSGEIAWRGPWPSDGIVRRETVTTPDGAWRVRVVREVAGGRAIWLRVASSLRDVDRQQHEVLETMWLAIPIALLIAGGGGLWIATRSLRPIEDALRMQRQFMADASHELRTPVSIVRAASDVALSVPRRSESEYRETLTIVKSQAQRLSRLVESMLALARADAGGYPIRRADLYLDEIVGECCRAVGVLCEERGVVITRRDWTELPFRGDEDLLRQMIVNVLQNAVQHTRAGGAVAVDLDRQDHHVTISIADAGPGIAAADRQRIFERFVRLDAARTGNGAGLGLPIARWIAEAHGGSLALTLTGPEGSTFRIVLPYPEAIAT